MNRGLPMWNLSRGPDSLKKGGLWGREWSPRGFQAPEQLHGARSINPPSRCSPSVMSLCSPTESSTTGYKHEYPCSQSGYVDSCKDNEQRSTLRSQKMDAFRDKCPCTDWNWCQHLVTIQITSMVSEVFNIVIIRGLGPRLRKKNL